jgi:hypothetical protein
VAAGSRETRDKTGPHGIVDRDHDDGHRRRQALRRAHRGYRAGEDYADAGLRQFARQVRKTLVLSRRETRFQHIVTALDQAVVAQPLIDLGEMAAVVTEPTAPA